MAVNALGVVAVLFFYSLILAAGIWAACRQKKYGRADSDSIILARRNIGLFVGVFTMTATWVGGGYVNGSAEAVYSNGIIWCQLPFGYSLSLVLGGLFFAKPMRDMGYTTMLDPFQLKYGTFIGGLLFLPALFGETMWTAAILSALGSTLSVILEMDGTTAIVTSAAVAVVYTFFGGLYSVAFTDVIQLFFIFVGLVLSIPFAWTHPAVQQSQLLTQNWFGSVDSGKTGIFVDYYLLLILGGIPYQAYFQRILSAKTSRDAQLLSFIAAFFCAVLSIPPILLGGIARSTDWLNGTDYGLDIVDGDQRKQILPLVLHYLTPQAVSFFGLGAISAAVMSSADSCILSASSMFTHNIYAAIINPKATGKHLTIVLRLSIVCVAAIATSLAIGINSIYGLSLLCSDLVYVLLFPQLVLVIYWTAHCNKYGCLTSFLVGSVLRILAGETLLSLPAIIHFPLYEAGEQRFPFRTLIMLIGIIVHIFVSTLTNYCFTRGWLHCKYDFLSVFAPVTPNPSLKCVNMQVQQ